MFPPFRDVPTPAEVAEANDLILRHVLGDFPFVDDASRADVKAALAAVGVTLGATDDDALAAVAYPLAGLVRDYRPAARLATT